MGGLGRAIGQRNGAVEGDTGLVTAAKLQQERTPYAKKMKVIRQPAGQRLDHLKRRLGAPDLRYGNRTIERDHG